jgi:transposase
MPTTPQDRDVLFAATHHLMAVSSAMLDWRDWLVPTGARRAEDGCPDCGEDHEEED